MARFSDIESATISAWNKFSEELEHKLGEDYDEELFFRIADSSVAKVDDYVMQATDFGVNCPSCGERLDNEDDLQGTGCIHCDTEYK